ncbi:FKBP-type peptidyl-prolyl cis-trans isomerase [Aurantiacibacter sp. MUD11]|uniref:FKBP-type peptidyl-prolyl cis-trans isomerase n=1 Tax=Aurantiacibacter sp. MUD11 TaxID=3003265 RepID=UPI0022AAD201|nr:FKBP-type peptidyl-prolyl cis-trans isomerase [Aurantiacibacter sp. MUD11]WAT19121.1 FKBP-type peptidyl-prolyl cis-trans isomerase [Aurantiacibacter sp. MUD11]
MAEVTRVLLQPVAKGSLTKLWLGVLAAVVLAALIAWAAMPKGLSVDTIRAGEGPNPTEESVVFVNYTGKLEDGTVFDQSQTLPLPIEGIFPDGTPLPLGDMIPGFRDALLQTQAGGQYEIFIPADQAYGADVPEGGPIPPNADLYFDIEVIEFMTREDFQQRVATFQQMMMQQQLDAATEEGAGE